MGVIFLQRPNLKNEDMFGDVVQVLDWLISRDISEVWPELAVAAVTAIDAVVKMVPSCF